jgi:hypothetical protein
VILVIPGAMRASLCEPLFPDEAQAHLAGRVAQALVERASELFAKPPTIEKLDVLAAKLPG